MGACLAKKIKKRTIVERFLSYNPTEEEIMKSSSIFNGQYLEVLK